MNIKNNQRARLTQSQIRNAYLELMKNTAPSHITVKELCGKAGINRSTFYQHYSQPNDVLIELEDDVIGRLLENMKILGAMPAADSSAMDFVCGFLQYVHSERELFELLLLKNSDPHFRRKLVSCSDDILRNFFNLDLPEGSSDFLYTYIIQGSISVIEDWMKTGYASDEKELSRVLFSLCEGSIWGLMKSERSLVS